MNYSFSSNVDASFLSTASQPNYPLKDPVFIIPNVPELTKVPEPKPSKRAPTPGYDMRTLRKQLEFLYDEIDQRSETQALLYRQNEELWCYSQSLLEANKVNINTMRSQVSRLHEELRVLHDERKQLADKLQLAQNSTELLRKLDTDICSLRAAGASAESVRNEAENQLKIAKEDRMRLERELEAQEAELATKHIQLDERRAEKLEQESLRVADKFFETNSAVLRSAYSRFKTSVCYRLRLTKIHNEMTRFYQKLLRVEHWRLWRRFINRRRIMHSNITSRNIECRDDCFKKWLFYTRQESVSKAGRRHVILKSYFQQWQKHNEYESWQKRSTFKINYFQNKQTARKFFIAWRSTVTFLDWNTDRTLRLEIKAMKYFMRRLLLSWAEVTTRDVRGDAHRSQMVKNIVFRGWLRKWRKECLLVWRGRARLSRRFFYQCKRLIQVSQLQHADMIQAAKMWIGLNKSMYTRRWMVFTRSRRHLQRGRAGIIRLALHRHRKTLRLALITVAKRVMINRRLNLRTATAVAFEKCGLIRRAVRHWQRGARTTKKSRILANRSILSTMWGNWTRLVISQKRDVLLANRAHRMFLGHQRDLMRCVFDGWVNGKQLLKRMRINAVVVAEKHIDCELRRAFCNWRSKWTRIIYWNLLERNQEVSRITALNDLKLREIEYLEQDNANIKSTACELEDSLVSLQETLAEKEMELQEKNSRLVALRQEKDHEMAALTRTREKLGSVIEERDRLRVIEQMVITNKRKEEEEMRMRKNESQRIMAALQADSEKLRDEVHQARSQSYLADKQAAVSIEREAQILEETVQAAHAMELLVQQRRHEIHSLEADKEILSNQLFAVQQDLDNIKSEGHKVLDEASSSIRSQTAENNQLSKSADLAEARVRELRGLVGEARDRLGAMTVDEIELDEQRELAELAHTSSFADEALRRSYARNTIYSAAYPESASSSSSSSFTGLRARDTEPLVPEVLESALPIGRLSDTELLRLPNLEEILHYGMIGKSGEDVVDEMKIQHLAKSIRGTLLANIAAGSGASNVRGGGGGGAGDSSDDEGELLDESFSSAPAAPFQFGHVPSRSVSERRGAVDEAESDSSDEDDDDVHPQSKQPLRGPTPRTLSSAPTRAVSGNANNAQRSTSSSGGSSPSINPTNRKPTPTTTSALPTAAGRTQPVTYGPSNIYVPRTGLSSSSKAGPGAGAGVARHPSPRVSPGTSRLGSSAAAYQDHSTESTRPRQGPHSYPSRPGPTASPLPGTRMPLSLGDSDSSPESTSSSGSKTKPQMAGTSSGRPSSPYSKRSLGPVGQRYENTRLTLQSLHDRLASKHAI